MNIFGNCKIFFQNECTELLKNPPCVSFHFLLAKYMFMTTHMSVNLQKAWNFFNLCRCFFCFKDNGSFLVSTCLVHFAFFCNLCCFYGSSYLFEKSINSCHFKSWYVLYPICSSSSGLQYSVRKCCFKSFPWCTF